MDEHVTLELPEGLAHSARTVTQRTQRSVEAVQLEWLGRVVTELPVAALPGDQVLALRDLDLSAEQHTALRALPARQHEGG